MKRVTAVASRGLLDDWRSNGPDHGVAMFWLGQAGFLLRSGSVRIAIDPYLSDSLARKYAGTRFPHHRLMPPAVDARVLGDLDYVFCTHRHSDHMDPDTLADLRDASPFCHFVVPAAELEHAGAIGLPVERTIAIDAGETLSLGAGLEVSAIAAAHEDIRRDAQGRSHFLGFFLGLGGAVVYHSGDCVPYAGLVETVLSHAPDVALLPINGRDETRRSNGVPGNFTLHEAMALAEQAGIPAMIGHHFGLFDFNTIDPASARAEIAALTSPANIMLAATGLRYQLK